MTKFSDNMESIFGLPTVIDVTPTEVTVANAQAEQPPSITQVDTDCQYARDNISAVIDRGQEALESLVELARESENPRTYEALAALMRTIADASASLVDIHKQAVTINNSDQRTKPGQTTINNSLYVGSTADLAKMLKDMRAGSTIDD